MFILVFKICMYLYRQRHTATHYDNYDNAVILAQGLDWDCTWTGTVLGLDWRWTGYLDCSIAFVDSEDQDTSI